MLGALVGTMVDALVVAVAVDETESFSCTANRICPLKSKIITRHETLNAIGKSATAVVGATALVNEGQVGFQRLGLH
jgi:hypothetical protein